MLTVRCRKCGKQLTSSPKIQVCGCANRLQLHDETISAVDLSQVVIVDSDTKESTTILNPQDLAFQEERRKRKVRKLDFEVR